MPRSLSHQVGILTMGRLLAYFVMFFVPIVNVRALSVEHYGYYRQFWLIFETLTPLLILGFPRSLLYYLPRVEAPREKAVYVTQTLLFLTVAAVVAAIVYTVMAKSLGSGLGAVTRAFYWRLVFFTLFMMTTQYMDYLFVAERDPLGQAVYHAASSATQAIVVIVASYVSRDVSVIIWSLTVFAVVKYAVSFAYTYPRYRPSFSLISLSTLKEQLSFALPMGLAGIALVMLSQTDKLIISRFLGREVFAVYSVGAFQVPFVNMIRGSVTNVTFPLMAQYQKGREYGRMLDLWQRALLKTVVLFFPLFIFLEVSARPFVVILFTEAYVDATPIFMIYMLLFLRSSVESGNIIQVFKKTMFIFYVFVVGFVVNLALSLLLFKFMGRIGVPIATVFTMYLINIVNLYYSSRLIEVSFFALIPVRPLLARFLAALAPGIGLWLGFRFYSVDNIFELAAAGMLYFATYFGLCIRLRYITLDDVKSLLGKKSTGE